ncbi:MAG: hypothetical protein J6334_02165, partial [Kiritimatiellae bacterium]|nr:hypothetical protein [Kiritimatiellia bacterium]
MKNEKILIFIYHSSFIIRHLSLVICHCSSRQLPDPPGGAHRAELLSAHRAMVVRMGFIREGARLESARPGAVRIETQRELAVP